MNPRALVRLAQRNPAVTIGVALMAGWFVGSGSIRLPALPILGTRATPARADAVQSQTVQSAPGGTAPGPANTLAQAPAADPLWG
jgi:hypothetical protein